MKRRAARVGLESVTMRWGDRVVLDDCTCEFVGPGMWAVTGPSGCGKSTLLNLMMGYLVPTSGTVTCDGSVGYMLQEDMLFSKLSVADNWAVHCAARSVPVDEAQRTELLGAVGLTGRDDQVAANLSGGERKRLQLAEMMAASFDFLLLDEPTAGLDDANKAILAELMKTLFGGVGVIVATHDWEFLGLLPAVDTLRMAQGKLVPTRTGAMLD